MVCARTAASAAKTTHGDHVQMCSGMCDVIPKGLEFYDQEVGYHLVAAMHPPNRPPACQGKKSEKDNQHPWAPHCANIGK